MLRLLVGWLLAHFALPRLAFRGWGREQPPAHEIDARNMLTTKSKAPKFQDINRPLAILNPVQEV